MKINCLILIIGIIQFLVVVASAQPDQTQVIHLEEWLNSKKLDVELNNYDKNRAKYLRKKFGRALGRKGKNCLCEIPLSEMISFRNVLIKKNNSHTYHVNFAVSSDIQPPKYDPKFNDELIDLLLNSRIQGTPLFDKILSISSFIINADITQFNIGLLAQPATVFNFNWTNLHPSDIQNSKYYRANKSNNDSNKKLRFFLASYSTRDFRYAHPIVSGNESYKGEVKSPTEYLKVVLDGLTEYLNSTKPFKEVDVKPLSERQIVISNLKNYLSKNDNYWERVHITLGQFSHYQERMYYVFIVDAKYYDAGVESPTESFWSSNGKDLYDFYGENLSAFQKKIKDVIFNQILK